MTRDLDNDEWLKDIGAVTVHEDDEKGDLWSAADPPLAASAEEFGVDEGSAESGRDYGIAEEEASSEFEPESGYSYAGERPFEPDAFAGERASGDDENNADPGLLLGPDLGVTPDPLVDPDTAVGDTRSNDSPPRRFTPWVLAAFGAAAVLATIVTLVVTMANSPSPESVAHSTAPVAPRTVEVAPPSAPPNIDGPLPFTASSDCPPGSTAAQSVADPNSTTPWVCVRSVDGQVLEIDLGRTFVITAVSIVPGAINKTDTNPDQPDPWLQHRVVTRAQWQFNDTDRTVKNQNTGNVRGEAVESIRPGVVASKITVIVQETSRPPAIAPTGPASPPPGSGPSILGDILGGNQNAAAQAPVMPGADASRDPADGTFAVSSIKIIGHKAV